MAYTSAAALIRDIKNEVGRIANKIARGVALVAFNDMQQAHAAIMDSFYAGYTPVQTYFYNYVSPVARGDGYNGTFAHYIGFAHGYRRTNNLRENSIIPIGIVPSGTHGFKATINISADNMNDYENSTHHIFPASAVFDLIWDKGIRGLPPGYRGHIGPVDINASPVGIPISGKPVDAMNQFINSWGAIRGGEVADQIAYSI